MDAFSLLKNSEAYKLFLSDKLNGKIFHAILIECDDEFMLNEYVKIFTQTLICKSEGRCGTCRECRLINSNSYCDVEVYPKGKKLSVSDIDDLVEKSYLKPLENDFKVFVLNNVQDMNIVSQNKLLKTLEEPPKNTYIILGATTVYPLLTTILSRVKKFVIKGFKEDEILSVLQNENYDKENLIYNVKFSSGKLGEVIKRGNSPLIKEADNLVKDLLNNLSSSKDIFRFANKITKDNVKEVISILNLILLDLLRYKSNKNLVQYYKEFVQSISNDYSFSSITFICDKLRECEKALIFNGNLQTIIDKILFAIVEGKRK